MRARPSRCARTNDWPPAGRRSPLGVVREALPVDDHTWFVADDPCVVPGRDNTEVARAEFGLLAIVHDHLHPAADEVAGVGGLAAVGPRDGLDVPGPLPAGLECCPADGSCFEVDALELALAVVKEPGLLGRGEVLADHVRHAASRY